MALTGVTEIDVKLGGPLTCRVAGALVTLSREAVTLAVPTETPAARPEALMVATAVLELTQVTVEVMSAVLASLKVLVAVNCRVSPFTIEVLTGVAEIEVNVGGADPRPIFLLTLAITAPALFLNVMVNDTTKPKFFAFISHETALLALGIILGTDWVLFFGSSRRNAPLGL